MGCKCSWKAYGYVMVEAHPFHYNSAHCSRMKRGLGFACRHFPFKGTPVQIARLSIWGTPAGPLSRVPDMFSPFETPLAFFVAPFFLLPFFVSPSERANELRAVQARGKLRARELCGGDLWCRRAQVSDPVEVFLGLSPSGSCRYLDRFFFVGFGVPLLK